MLLLRLRLSALYSLVIGDGSDFLRRSGGGRQQACPTPAAKQILVRRLSLGMHVKFVVNLLPYDDICARVFPGAYVHVNTPLHVSDPRQRYGPY